MDGVVFVCGVLCVYAIGYIWGWMNGWDRGRDDAFKKMGKTSENKEG
jgi:hypothetical protein